MKKNILFLIMMVVLLLSPAMNVSAETKVAKPTIKVIRADAGMTNFSVSTTTKKAKIYYTTDGKTPTTKSKSLKSGAELEVDTDKISNLRFRAHLDGTYSTTVKAPKYVEVGTPKLKATVKDNGDIHITITSTTEGAKFYYKEGTSGVLTNKNSKTGKTLIINYKDAPSKIQIIAHHHNTYSKRANLDLDKLVKDKYESLLKETTLNATKGANTDLEKLMAIWKWTMMNCNYAFKGNTSKADTTYCLARHLLFDRKAVCAGYVRLWVDMTKVLGIESHYVSIKGADHAVAVTKLDGKWFIVDSTNGYHTTDVEEIRYDHFLDNELSDYSKDFFGYDTSSDRYIIEHSNGNKSSYFEYLNYDGIDGDLIYDSVKDKYTFEWYE